MQSRSALPPPRISLAICVLALAATSFGQGTVFQGPNPWVDVNYSSYGGVDDGRINVTAAVTGTTTQTLTVSAAPGFLTGTPNDAGKPIALAALPTKGIMTAPMLTTVTASCGGTGAKVEASFVNFGSGDGIYIDGGNGSAQVQVGTLHKVRCDGCKFGIRAPGNFSDIEVDGGALTSSDTSASGTGIGLDFERDANSGIANGNLRIHDVALRDFPAGQIKLVDIPAATIVQIKEENINTAVQGIGISLETAVIAGTAGIGCSGTRIAFPVISSSATAINVGAGCSNIDIYKPIFSSNTTNITDNGTNTSWVTDETGPNLGAGTPFITSSNTSATGRTVNISIPNETSTGTTVGRTAVLSSTNCPTGAPVCAKIAPTTATSGIVGIVVLNGGTSGNAVVAITGIAGCLFDGNTAVAAGNYVMPSSSVPGGCRASTSRPSNEILGVALDSAGGGVTTKQIRVLLSLQGQ